MGELTCSAKVAKLILTICNLVVMLAGVALFATGIWFVADPNARHILRIADSVSSITPLIGAAGGIIIGSGALLFIFGLIGFYGALSHKTGCLNCFSAILIILVILQIAAAILAGVFHNQITTGLTTSMKGTMKLYKDQNITREAWNFVQYEFQCCGVNNATNWQDVNWSDDPDQLVPDTCCVLTNKNYLQPEPKNKKKCFDDVSKGITDKDEGLYFKGCEQSLEDWAYAQMGPLIGVAIAVVVIEIFGVVLSCLLASKIKSGYEYV